MRGVEVKQVRFQLRRAQAGIMGRLRGKGANALKLRALKSAAPARAQPHRIGLLGISTGAEAVVTEAASDSRVEIRKSAGVTSDFS